MITWRVEIGKPQAASNLNISTVDSEVLSSASFPSQLFQICDVKPQKHLQRHQISRQTIVIEIRSLKMPYILYLLLIATQAFGGFIAFSQSGLFSEHKLHRKLWLRNIPLTLLGTPRMDRPSPSGKYPTPFALNQGPSCPTRPTLRRA
jgi:hypothetical protein